MRAVAANFFFNCWYLEIPSDNRIRHMPRFVHYDFLEFLCCKWKPYPRVLFRLPDGGMVVSSTLRPRSSPQKHYFSTSDTHFCYISSKPQGLVRVEGLGELKKIHSPHQVSNSRSTGLCSIAP
jgi:hypothetical protein